MRKITATAGSAVFLVIAPGVVAAFENAYEDMAAPVALTYGSAFTTSRRVRQISVSGGHRRLIAQQRNPEVRAFVREEVLDDAGRGFAAVLA
jgi:hypothetical protein